MPTASSKMFSKFRLIYKIDTTISVWKTVSAFFLSFHLKNWNFPHSSRVVEVLRTTYLWSPSQTGFHKICPDSPHPPLGGCHYSPCTHGPPGYWSCPAGYPGWSPVAPSQLARSSGDQGSAQWLGGAFLLAFLPPYRHNKVLNCCIHCKSCCCCPPGPLLACYGYPCPCSPSSPLSWLSPRPCCGTYSLFFWQSFVWLVRLLVYQYNHTMAFCQLLSSLVKKYFLLFNHWNVWQFDKKLKDRQGMNHSDHRFGWSSDRFSPQLNQARFVRNSNILATNLSQQCLSIELRVCCLSRKNSIDWIIGLSSLPVGDFISF